MTRIVAYDDGLIDYLPGLMGVGPADRCIVQLVKVIVKLPLLGEVVTTFIRRVGVL